MIFRLKKQHRVTVNIFIIICILLIYLNTNKSGHELWPVIYKESSNDNPQEFYRSASNEDDAKFTLNRNLNILDLSAKVKVTNKTCHFNSSIKTPIPITVLDKILDIKQVEEKFAQLKLSIKLGGRYSPVNCQARFKVAIIIPYRNRAQMLATYMNHMHKFLMTQNIDYGFYLVEPMTRLTFNRGLLLNIGFIESLKISNNHWDCFIFHDIDLLPEDGRNIYSCPLADQPRHMSSLVSSLNYK